MARRASAGEPHQATLLHRLGPAIVDALPIEIALLDVQGKICWVNLAWRRSGGPAEGADIFSFCEGEAAEQIRAVLSGQQPAFTTDYPFRLPEGLWRSATFIAIQDQEFEGAIAIQETTSRVLLPSQDAVSALQLPPREQRIQAVGRLVGGIAHDFANVLTLISGHAGILLNRVDEKDPLRSGLQEIRDAADRASRLTAQLLGFSRGQATAERILDLNALIADMGKMLRPIIGEDIAFVTVLTAGDARIKADPGQMEQVIMNLVLNARDAMPRGGRLTIETAGVELDEPTARLHEVTPGAYVMLTVSDTGEGMEEEVRCRLFEPFFTTKEKGKGTGLGLSTVHAIVRQHHGAIWVTSHLHQGSRFFVCLPRAEEVGASQSLVATQPEPASGTETILLVEDEEGVRRLLKHVLTRQGYTVLEAGDGETALSVFEQNANSIQLLLTDMVIPKLNGRELAQSLLARWPQLKVIYISGYSDDVLLRTGALHPGMSFLQKPLKPEVLASKVREVLDAPAAAGSESKA